MDRTHTNKFQTLFPEEIPPPGGQIGVGAWTQTPGRGRSCDAGHNRPHLMRS